MVADEIHAPLVYDTEFVPYLSVDPRGFSVMAASKAWNLAGTKAGLLVAGEEAVAELSKLPREAAHGASHFGVIAQTAAYREGGDWLEALLAGLDSNRRLLGELLSDHLPELTWTAPQGTYLAWLDFSAYGFEDDVAEGGEETPIKGPAKFLLQQAKVALTAGHPFGTGGERHARLNFAASQQTITEAVERMGAALR